VTVHVIAQGQGQGRRSGGALVRHPHRAAQPSAPTPPLMPPSPLHAP